MLMLLSLLCGAALAEDAPAAAEPVEAEPASAYIELVPNERVWQAKVSTIMPASVLLASGAYFGLGHLLAQDAGAGLQGLFSVLSTVSGVGLAGVAALSVPVSGVLTARLANSLNGIDQPTPSWAGWSGAAISGGAVAYSVATLRNEAFLDQGGPIVLGTGAAVGWGLAIVQMKQNHTRLDAFGQWPPRNPRAQLTPVLTPSYAGLELRAVR